MAKSSSAGCQKYVAEPDFGTIELTALTIEDTRIDSFDNKRQNEEYGSIGVVSRVLSDRLYRTQPLLGRMG
jgi:hypothetical protein